MSEGKLEMLIGPMYSGKTGQLITKLQTYTYSNCKTIVIKHAKDVRFNKSNTIATRNGSVLTCHIETDLLMKHVEVCCEYDVIGVDEGHFFPDLYQFCMKMLSLDKIVIVAALNLKYDLQPWDQVHKMIPHGRCKFLNARCGFPGCGKKAQYTMRLDEQNKSDIQIGDIDQYRAMCYKHHPLFKNVM